MEAKSATYEPSSRIEKLRERALAQPDAMFLPMHRPYFYVEGWMDAKGESPADSKCQSARKRHPQDAGFNLG